MTPAEVETSTLCWHGPEWFKSNISLWPSVMVDFQTSMEEKRAQVYVARSSEGENILYRFSCLGRVIHVVTWIFRFVSVAHNRTIKLNHSRSLRLTSHELSFARDRPFLLS